MKGETRRKLVMGARALEFSRAHPDESAGYTAALAQLEEQVALSYQLADQQRQGVVEVRAASARKRDLYHAMRRHHLVHVAAAARWAAKELPELAQKFVLPRNAIPYLEFTSLARTMVAEARRHQELLIRYGLVEGILDSLEQLLEDFYRAVEQGAEGRRSHINAGVKLDSVAHEIVQIIKVIDGVNRVRFADQADLLAAWKAARNVEGPRRRVVDKAAVDGVA